MRRGILIRKRHFSAPYPRISKKSATRHFSNPSHALKSQKPRRMPKSNVTRNCRQCGKEFRVLPRRARARLYCSITCWRKSPDLLKRLKEGRPPNPFCRICKVNRKSNGKGATTCKKCHAFQEAYRRKRGYKQIILTGGRKRVLKDSPRLTILKHYSNGHPHCICCGEDEIRFLTVDHRHNDGNKERFRSTTNLYTTIIRNGFPDSYQILCFNCNSGRALNKGICPHKQAVSEKSANRIVVTLPIAYLKRRLNSKSISSPDEASPRGPVSTGYSAVQQP